MTHDVIIIGGGPAGLAAAVYGARYNLNVLLLSKDTGGTITKAHKVCNWPGEQEITGMELMKKWEEHVKQLKVTIENEEALDIKKVDDLYVVNDKYRAKTILLTTGTVRRKLGLPEEDSYIGKGVSYCATCDAAFYKNLNVAVVGGSDSACSSATMLKQFAKKVYVIYRKDKLRAEPYWVKIIEDDPEIEVIYEANVTKIQGEPFVKSIILDNDQQLDVEGLFIEIGSVPSTALAALSQVELEKNHIKVDEKQATNVKGIYAAGDCTTNSNMFKQVLTAASEGAIAMKSIYEYCA